MSVLAEVIVAILQVASVLILLYGFSLTIDNGLNKALTFVAKLGHGVSRAQIDGLANAA